MSIILSLCRSSFLTGIFYVFMGILFARADTPVAPTADDAAAEKAMQDAQNDANKAAADQSGIQLNTFHEADRVQTATQNAVVAANQASVLAAVPNDASFNSDYVKLREALKKLEKEKELFRTELNTATTMLTEMQTMIDAKEQLLKDAEAKLQLREKNAHEAAEANKKSEKHADKKHKAKGAKKSHPAKKSKKKGSHDKKAPEAAQPIAAESDQPADSDNGDASGPETKAPGVLKTSKSKKAKKHK